MNSSSNTNGHFDSANGSATVIGHFDSASTTDFRAIYHEAGTDGGFGFTSDWSNIITDTASDSGDFTATDTTSTVNGEFAKSSSANYLNKFHQWGSTGSASATLTNFDLNTESKSTRNSSSSGTYSAGPDGSSSKGEYSSTQSDRTGETNHTWGSNSVAGNITHFDDVLSYSYNTSNSDSGTFSSTDGSSSSNGTAEASSRKSSSHTRRENGPVANEEGKGKFTMNSNSRDYQISSTTSHYSAGSDGSYSANGPYSSVTINGSNYSYNEDGTTAGGATYSVFQSSSANSTNNDSGEFNESNTGWSRDGNYSMTTASRSNSRRSQNGNLTGDGITGTYSTFAWNNSSQSVKDEAGYSSSPSGLTGNGSNSSSWSQGAGSSYTESGTRTTPDRTSNFNHSENLSISSSKTETGTHSLGSDGTTTEGTSGRSSTSSKSTSSNEYGNLLGCEPGTFNESSNSSESEVSNASGPYTRSPEGLKESGNYTTTITGSSGWSTGRSGTIACDNVTGTYSSSASNSSSRNLDDEGSYSLGPDGYSGNGNYILTTTSSHNSSSSRTETTTTPQSSGTVTTQSSSTTNSNYNEDGDYEASGQEFTGGAPSGGTKTGTATFTHDITWSSSSSEDISANSPSMTGTEHEHFAESHTFHAEGGFSFTNDIVSNVQSTWTQSDTWDHVHVWDYIVCVTEPAGCFPWSGSESETASGTTSGSGYNPYYQLAPPLEIGAGGTGGGGYHAGSGAGGAFSISALDYARLSRGAYGDKAHLGDLASDWDIKVWEDAASGFKARLFVNKTTGACVLAFAGTDLELSDWQTNVGQGVGLQSLQYEMAIELVGSLKNSKKCGGKLTLTGHSLGGGLASAAALVHGLHATTFNAAGVHAATVRRHGGSLDNAPALIDAYRVRGEPLSFIQDRSLMPDGIGTTYWLEHPWTWKWWEWHSIDAVIEMLGG